MDTFEEPQLEKRTSYFDIIKQTLANKHSMTTTLILVGSFKKDADRAEYTTHFQRMFRGAQTEVDRITGVLLAYRSSFLHLVEAPSRIITTFLDEIQRDPQTDSVRVLCFLDDVPDRKFPFWASRILDTKEDTSDLKQMDPQALDDYIIQACTNLFTIGANLSSLSKTEMKSAFEDIVERFRGLLPSASTVGDLARSKDLMTVQEWIEEFTKLEVVLESELVWPVPKPIVI